MSARMARISPASIISASRSRTSTGRCKQLEIANAEQLTGKDGVDASMAGGGHANFEMKWSGPDGVVIDISHTGWEGTH